MTIRILLRGGIYILFAAAVMVGWLLKRRRSPQTSVTNITDALASPDVTEMLQHPRWEVRAQAVQVLAEKRDATTLPNIIALLNDPDADVREAAVQAAAVFGEDAVRPLSSVLENGALHSREAAARSLGIIRSSSAIPALQLALSDRSAWVRKQAAQALGDIGSPQAVSVLAARFYMEDDQDVQETIRLALSHIGPPEALVSLSPQVKKDS